MLNLRLRSLLVLAALLLLAHPLAAQINLSGTMTRTIHLPKYSASSFHANVELDPDAKSPGIILLTYDIKNSGNLYIYHPTSSTHINVGIGIVGFSGSLQIIQPKGEITWLFSYHLVPSIEHRVTLTIYAGTTTMTYRDLTITNGQITTEDTATFR